jgi:formylglycine-generating enzyme required for sulfatase activity
VSRLFISHSSRDSVSAKAFKQWLGGNGWPQEDVFLDVDDIGAGERWKDALRKANSRCEAVILLATPEALSSAECLAEVRKAEDYGKDIIVVLLRDLQFDDQRLDSYKDRQIVNLAAPPSDHVEKVSFHGEDHEIRFNADALSKIKEYLFKRGITPDHFGWPPQNNPDAEPFPGLSAFTEDDAGIFFGRDSDILRGLDKLRILRRNGRPNVLGIQAASGAGKSSYLRAGLWPRLGRDRDFVPIAILRPAQGILTGPEGLGRRLAARLSRPGRPINPGDIHGRLMADDETQACSEFAGLVEAIVADAQEQRRFGEEEAHAPAPLLAIDQAEELFVSEQAAESQRFMKLFASLLRDPPAGVEPFGLFTIRSDSAARLFQVLTDLKLELPETLTLLPLPRTSYRDVVLKPLDVIAQRGQRLAISTELADRLVADASGADALPLLAFTLSHLYQEYGAGGSIALAQYEAMGGVAGSIELALKWALAKPGDEPTIPAAKDAQVAALRAAFIPWLARIDVDTGLPMRRVARMDEFPPTSLAVVERLVEARLLVRDRRSGVDIVEIAHESLLRQWPALSEWLKADAADLEMVDAVERAAKEWSRNGRQQAWLDHRGERLTAAEHVASREDFRKRLGKEGIDYITACRVHEEQERAEKAAALQRERRQRVRVAALIGGFSVVLLAGIATWKYQRPLQNELYRLGRVHALTTEQERALKLHDTFKECTDCPEMVVIPAGGFKMGSPDSDHIKSESPQHDVTIAQPFAVGQFELTFDEWDACAARGDCNPNISANGWGRGRRPVIEISWEDAKVYVAWLSKVTGKPYRLLSEAEWEYAARANRQAYYHFGNDDGILDQYAWFAPNAGNQTHPVGEKKSNSFGLYDVHGNVSEWVEDCFHDGYQGAPLDGSVWPADNCSRRVIRGGSWIYGPRPLRAASRDWSAADKGKDDIGVRVARTLIP